MWGGHLCAGLKAEAIPEREGPKEFSFSTRRGVKVRKASEENLKKKDEKYLIQNEGGS